jgi:hypothetical protein
MKFSNFQRKSISLIVMFTFLALLHFMAAPAQAAPLQGNSETAIQQGDSGGPSFIEEEGDTEAVYKKSKKFPWLIVGLGVVAVGAALYFLVLKKTKYTLSVSLDAGCTGTPAATTKYKKDEVVSYSYTAKPGYGNLQVKLDGAAAPASGTITMNKDKVLTVTSEQVFTLNVNKGAGCSGTPATSALYKVGSTVSYHYTVESSAYINLLVKLDGATVPATGTVTMDKDHTLTITATPLDIRGSWSIDYKATNTTMDWTWPMSFSGSMTSGTASFYAGGINFTGTYTVSGKKVVVKYSIFSPNDIVMTGNFTSKDAMAGTVVIVNINIGDIHVTGATWKATRLSSPAQAVSQDAFIQKAK